MGYTPEQFGNYYASPAFAALMESVGWSFECSDFNETFYPCPYPYVPQGTWTWNGTGNITYENGPCQIPYAQLEDAKGGVMAQRLVWLAYFGGMAGIVTYRLWPMRTQKKKVNSVQMCTIYTLLVCILGVMRIIDFAGGNDVLPYVCDGIFVNLQVALLLCILYTITNSWVAVMATKGTRAKTPRKWRIAYKIWVITTLLVNLSAPIIEAVPSTEGMILVDYFGKPVVAPFLGFYGSSFGGVRLLSNTALCLSYATACFLFARIAKKLKATSSNDSKTEATKRQVAQIRKYQMGIQLVVVMACAYWVMTFFGLLSSPHVFEYPKCTFMGAFLDIPTCIVSITVFVAVLLLNPRKKKKKRVGAATEMASSVSDGSSQETSSKR